MRRENVIVRRSFGALMALLMLVFGVTQSLAQPRIAALRPDAAAPGMNVVVEILAPALQLGAFGSDGLSPTTTQFVLEDSRDSTRIVVGPLSVGWNGRLLQVPLFVMPGASTGPVAFHISSPQGSTQRDTFNIQSAQHLGTLTGTVVLGEGAQGVLTSGNTLVVDSLTLTSSFSRLSLATSDSNAANPRFQPLTILSKGPIRITASELSVSAHGLDGGPGGGGGGHGHVGTGGAGYTGGGSSSSLELTNVGAGGPAVDTAGGPSLTGTYGGQSEKSDQGGGGGTGHPFGTSGRAGVGRDTSRGGGYGGGSAGGEQASQLQAYGGGGGGFGTAGANGEGVGANGGKVVGGRFLVPLAGGSGGGAGNALNEAPDAGSGGGGGGAISIVTFDSLLLSDATLSAAGDSGTSGANLTAGGGGGAGGAILIETAKGALGENFTANVSGGAGGAAGLNGGNGGRGGDGRIRFDGVIDNCIQCGLQNVVRGVSTFPDTSQQHGNYVVVRGVPSAPQQSSDTIRIFFRTRHTAWQFVDTVREASGGPLRWKKWIPAQHDSLIFVAAYAKVLTPDKSVFNYEPDWLPSHVSLTVVRHLATPLLVVQDSLWLGGVRRGHCGDTWLRVENRSEQPLRIDSATIAGASAVKILSTLPKIIKSYSVDSILVHFCPDSVKSYSARLTLFSNDSTRSVKLTGQGLERSDSVRVVPSSIDLGRVRIGTCDSIDVKAYTIGNDTAYISSRVFTVTPFTLRLLSADTALAPGDTAQFRLYYCLTDTGHTSANFNTSAHSDTLSVRAYIVMRRFTLGASTDSIALCGSSIGSILDTISSIGNDTATLLKVRSRAGQWSTILSTPQPLTTPILATWTTSALNAGVIRDTLQYIFSDTTIEHVVVYRRTIVNVGAAAQLKLRTTCVGTCDSIQIGITNAGTDTTTIHLTLQSPVFSAGTQDFTLAPTSTDSIWITFCPSAAASYGDTLQITARANECEEMIATALLATATDNPLSLDSITFDSTRLGECTTDSITLSNPCGPDVTIVSADVLAPFSIDASQLPFTVASHSERRLAVTYCPDKPGDQQAIVKLVTGGHETFTTSVIGHAVDTALHVPHIFITLKPLQIAASSTDAMPIVLDSSTEAGVHHVTGHVKFDRAVVVPSNATAPWTVTGRFTDSLRIEAEVDLGSRQTIGAISWTGLLGPRSISPVLVTWDIDTANSTDNSTSAIEVIDCSGLAGKIVPGGNFSLSEAFPNPAKATVSFLLASSAPAEIRLELTDEAGRSERVLSYSANKGLNVLNVQTSGLPAGLHHVRIEGIGWSETRRILVDK